MAKSLLSVPSIVPTLSVILGIPWLGTQACKRPNDSCAGSSLTEAECASPSGRETPSLMSSSKEIELTVSEEDRLLDTVEEGRLLDISEEELRHSIFLSHSGAQKNFVEQLCEDLERAKQRPFFDKRPQSLPKGEIFAQYIFNAAQQCELAIVVVSEEYFSRSKWPMTELCAFVQSGKCKILPLFFGLSCKDFGNSERRQRWFRTWDAWAQADPRIRLEDWKNALRELERRNGLEYVEALGEVVFRKDVVATACTIIQKSIKQKSLEDEVLLHPPCEQVLQHISIYKRFKSLCLRGTLIILTCLGGIAALIAFYVLFGFIFFRIIVPIMKKYVLQIEP